MQQILREHLPAFLRQSGDDLPRYVVQELEDAAACGVFGRGVACFLCDGCGQREFVPFSCKRRGFCPSCCGRRMNDIALPGEGAALLTLAPLLLLRPRRAYPWPSKAAWMAAMSSFRMPMTAAKARSRAAVSGLAIQSAMPIGTTCQ